MALRALNRFWRDTAGNYASLFALAAFPIIGVTSLAVDYANLERHRSAVQNSLDAAALATAKQFSAGVTGDELTQYAEDFFESNLPDFISASDVELAVSITDEQITDSNGDPQTVKAVTIDADFDYDTFIARVVGHETFHANMSAQVALGNITVEVALVMDNSGSMANNNKLTTMKTTAKDLIDTIFAAASNSNKPNPVSFSLVPFASHVNVGTANANAKWMDTKGLSPIHHENLNWWSYITANDREWIGPAYKETVNGVKVMRSRFDVYNMLGIAWTGCVEFRPWPHNTLDTVAVTQNAVSGEDLVDENSSADLRARLFVPTFAPNEPRNKYAWKTSSGGTTHYNDTYTYSNNYLYDWKRKESDNITITQLRANEHDFSDYNKTAANYSFSYGTGSYAEIQSNQNKRQDTMFPYQVKQWVSGGVSNYTGYSKGPNLGCTAIPMTQLTVSQSAAKAAVDSMIANGNTNIQAGVSWGWKTLSPNEPFTTGRDPDDETNRKYMIVLTDGNNTYNSSSTPNQTGYAMWGYGKHGRIDQGLTASDLAGTPYVGDNLDTFEKKMNAHTVQTCNNAKNDGVTIFAIAFDVSDGSSVKEMLEACSGSGVVNGSVVQQNGVFYYDVDGATLQEAMASIAAQISEMRLMN
jgi:Flp pilus assembly protein TadG